MQYTVYGDNWKVTVDMALAIYAVKFFVYILLRTTYELNHIYNWYQDGFAQGFDLY